MFTHTKTLRLLLPLLIGLAGCGDKNGIGSFDLACEKQQKFCLAIHEVPACTVVFKQSVVAYYRLKENTLSQDAAHFLRTVTQAEACNQKDLERDLVRALRKGEKVLSKQSSVRDLQLQNKRDFSLKKSQKRENLLTFADYREQVEQQFPVSRALDDHMLYWQWTQNESTAALNLLLARLNDDHITDSAILYDLAQHLSGTYQPGVTTTLYKSLKHYPVEDYESTRKHYKEFERPLHFKIFRDLVKLHYRQENYKASYIFARLLTLNHDPSVSLQQIQAKMDAADRHKLDDYDDMADTIHDSLLDGQFNYNLG